MTDLPIFTVRNGTINLSPYMVCMCVLLFVRLVGLIAELTTKSSIFPPIHLTILSLTHDSLKPMGIPSSGLVNTTPAILKSVYQQHMVTTTRAPRLCPYTYNGSLQSAILTTSNTSSCSSSTSEHPLAPPEYPKPRISTIRISQLRLQKNSATCMNRPECSPSPWIMSRVPVGVVTLGVRRVVYSRRWGFEVHVKVWVRVWDGCEKLPRNQLGSDV